MLKSLNLCRNPFYQKFIGDVCAVQSRGIKYFTKPPTYDDVEIPVKAKPKFVEKVPQNLQNIKMPKMTKNLRFMRGPEEVHNELIHKQYGII
ncbi:hypothetical protein GE061_017981, partial [Apolygus lucorum]